jgi:hypothetical protein
LQAPFNISKNDLIPYYFPKQVVVYPEKLSYDDGANGKIELPTRSWISTNGSRFRYALDDRHSRVLLNIQLKGAAKEIPVALSPDGTKLLEDPPAKAEEPAQAQEPAKPSEDSTPPAAASQPE